VILPYTVDTFVSIPRRVLPPFGSVSVDWEGGLASLSNNTARAEATLSPEGDVLCTCGKILAKTDANEIEFKCKCGLLVRLPNQALLLKNYGKALDTIQFIVSQMAQSQSAAQ
jgi:hypothetical protein